jgi:hypothetical protein
MPAVREVRVDVARVDNAVQAYEVQHRLRLAQSCLGPRFSRDARVHQRVHRARQEAVVDEEVLLHRQPRIAALEIPRAVAGDAVPQSQVLRARWRNGAGPGGSAASSVVAILWAN